MSPPVAIITGASQGIGAGLVAGYRSAGYAVVGVALSFPSAQQEENDYIQVAGDVADRQTARRAVDEARDRFGRLDTLINNAGIYIGKPFTEYTFDEYDAITAVNLTGFFHFTQLAIAEMAARGRGHVVNISTSLVEQRRRAQGRLRCPRSRREDSSRPAVRLRSNTPPAASASTQSRSGSSRHPPTTPRPTTGSRRSTRSGV